MVKQEKSKHVSAAKDILLPMVDSMGVVDYKFSTGEISVPEMLIPLKQ